MGWMMRQAAAAVLIGGSFMGAAGGAQAAAVVFGSTSAQNCYEAAQFGTATSGLRECDDALREGALTARDRAATLVNRGILHNRAKDYDQAIVDFNAALAMDGDLGPAFLNRGNSYFFMKDLTNALADYDRAIELESRDLHSAYFNRGLVYVKRGDNERALDDFRMALEIKPDFVAAEAVIAQITNPAPAAPAAEDQTGE